MWTLSLPTAHSGETEAQGSNEEDVPQVEISPTAPRLPLTTQIYIYKHMHAYLYLSQYNENALSFPWQYCVSC